MSYNLRDIFFENMPREGKRLHEGIVSDLLGSIKNLIVRLVSKSEVKNVDRVLGLLKNLKRIGVKRVGGLEVNTAVRELVQYKRELMAGDTDEVDDMQLASLLRNIQKHAPKQKAMNAHTTKSSQKRRKMKTNKALKLSDIFSEESETLNFSVEKESEKGYNTNEPMSPTDKNNTIIGNAADDDPGLSDEEILSGLRDDVANYGDTDPVLDD